ncbi:MAG: vitamin B12 dependent-methionine synthase activation domain-containing protein [Peptostreptococcaceae bacterium]
MFKNFDRTIQINIDEVLRYLEYKNQSIDDNLNHKIEECINITKETINPRYTFRVYSINTEKQNLIELEGTNLQLESNDLYNLLKDCHKCILMATTIGLDIEKQIRKYSYTELTKSIIIDSCGTTAIEEVCDIVEDKIKEEVLVEGEYLTYRYSPGYGDLNIESNTKILNILNGHKEIGLTITDSGIMIPRKSVVAIIGIKNTKSNNKKSCHNCKNKNTCKYRKRGSGCGS